MKHTAACIAYRYAVLTCVTGVCCSLDDVGVSIDLLRKLEEAGMLEALTGVLAAGTRLCGVSEAP